MDNPYHSSSGIHVATDDVTISSRRVFFDFRCFATSLLAIAMGSLMWKVQSIMSGNVTFQPDFYAMMGWLTFCGFVTGVIDPRSPWINWLSLYFGTYILTLTFFPRDPLMPFALVVGIFLIGFCAVIGTLIPSCIAYAFPLRLPNLRRWAGYTDTMPEPSDTQQALDRPF